MRFVILMTVLLMFRPLHVKAEDFDFAKGQEIIDDYNSDFDLDNIYNEVKKG